MKSPKIIMSVLFVICLLLLIVFTYKLDNKDFEIQHNTAITTHKEESTQRYEHEKRTIVCFGDSIFGMYRDDTSVPSYIASVTGDTVYNVGFGGCRMAKHPYTGYNEFCMYALAQAITTKDYSQQDSAVAEGSSYFPEQLELLKSIDFNAVDIIVIHYGINDLSGGVPIDNPENPTDISTFRGALKYSIETISSSYPHIKFFISLPTFHYRTNKDGQIVFSDEYFNRNGYTVFDYISAIESVAEEYSLSVIDSYYELKIDRSNAEEFLADGIHHNEQGRKCLGEYIAYRLLSEFPNT